MSTIIIIAITCLVSFGAFKNDKIKSDLIMWPPAISRQKQWYRFVTSGFIHADMQHLFFNMFTLYFFGRAIEELYKNYLGSFGFYIFYIMAIIISEIPSYVKNRNNSSYASLGASGGVSAVVFSYILLAPWSWFQFPPLPAIIYGIGYLVYTVYMSKKQSDNINHDAHFWGAIFGVTFTLLLDKNILPYFLNQLMHPHGPGF
jgi:membrane associated rhomboid family serine protease